MGLTNWYGLIPELFPNVKYVQGIMTGSIVISKGTKVINQVRQWVLQQALQEALGTLKSCLNNELHLRTASANIGMFGTMKEKIID
ncbi:hypothetical protein JHK87_044986 [Glycine soja]|nr:hypothetical protein JHK87_044986 [Glycine soja]